MSQATRFNSRRIGLVFGILVLILSASLISAFSLGFQKPTSQPSLPNGFFLGVTASGNVAETLRLIDKVKGYTNVIAFTDLDLTENLTSLQTVSDYAVKNGLSFMVSMVYPSSYAKNFTYNPTTWVPEAKARYGERFLGYYLWDEPGGHQLDRGNFRQFDSTSMPYDYRDAANTYVYYLFLQMRDFIKTDKLFTTDYALYWYDYEAGYDVVMAQFGWNNSRPVDIALCRGAAEMHNKTWGAMMTWTYMQPPYYEPAPLLYQDMVTAYDAGAKYVMVFNYPQTGPYGVLSEEHFDTIKQFNAYVQATPQNKTSNIQKLAYVVPDNYGWGFRSPTDNIWGVWPADDKAQGIWNDVNGLVQEYGDGFDIIYDSPWTMLFGSSHYDQMIYWNRSIK